MKTGNYKIVILSDIHIGSNEPTNWYQASVHEPYLVAALNWIEAHGSQIDEFIILGDLIDFWTYLPTATPPPFFSDIPSIKTIMGANPGIFGFYKPAGLGALAKAAAAVGKCIFISGNHDMTMTQDMLNTIVGAKISLVHEKLYAPMNDPKVQCTHGHDFSMMCAQDHEETNNISPLPIGYYATRAGAYYADQKLKESGKKNVAELAGTGEPTGADFTYEDYVKIISEITIHSLGYGIADAIYNVTGLGWDAEIKLPPVTDYSWPKSTSLQLASENFGGLLNTWENKVGLDGEKMGYEGALDALRYPDIDNDLAPYAKAVAQNRKAKVVVFGHTHVPLDNQNSLKELSTVEGEEFIYANSGFNCPSLPDMHASTKRKHPTFVQLEYSNAGYAVSVMQVERTPGGQYQVPAKPLMGPYTIPA